MGSRAQRPAQPVRSAGSWNRATPVNRLVDQAKACNRNKATPANRLEVQAKACNRNKATPANKLADQTKAQGTRSKSPASPKRAMRTVSRRLRPLVRDRR